MLSLGAFILTSLLLAPMMVASLPLAPGEVERRSGPSGYVVYPPSGATFAVLGLSLNNNGAGGDGYINIQYQRVEGFNGTTLGVDLYLHDPSGNHPDGYLTYNFGPDSGSSLIEGNFSPPSGYCGYFELVFVEHQLQGFETVIKFQSAAPGITIECPPFQ